VENGKLSLKSWKRETRRWHIAHTIAAPSGGLMVVDNTDANNQMIKLARAQSRLISGLAVANPWYGKRAVSILQRAFEGGLVGLYLDPARQGFQLSESIIDPLIEVCREYDRPVYSHTGTPVCAMPFQLAELAQRFPTVTFVMGHAAWTDFNGYDVIPVARKVENIMVETSCTVGAFVQAAIDQLGADRLLFGTGYPASLPAYEFAKFSALKLERAVAAKIMRENAIRLWKLRL
jgi:predicted TIM-barrel fold metal-dependent hydrolase